MRYTKLRTWAILIIAVLGVIVFLNYAGGGPGIYKAQTPISDSLITNIYPDLYEVISQRDAQKLKPYISYNSSEVQAQAWRAFANTPTDSISQFIELAAKQNTEVAWFGISMHSLSGSQLRSLEKRWQNNPDSRKGIAQVLGRQGDEQSLQFLLDQLDTSAIKQDYHLGLAVGRLIAEYDISENQQVRVIQNAFNADSYEITRAYLYGWYRGDASRLSPVAQDTLMSRWRVLGSGTKAGVDQYINKMMPERTTSELAIFYNGEQRLESEIQVSVELATSISDLELNDRNSLAAKILLTNANPHVQVRTLQSLSDKISRDKDLYNYISGTMLTNTQLADEVWLQALETSAEVDSILVEKYDDRLIHIPQENPYLTPQVLAVYEKAKAPDKYLDNVEEITRDDTLKTMYALQSVNRYWQNMPDQQQTDQFINRVRDFVVNALDTGDRGIAYMAQPLLQKEQLFTTEDFDQINSTLSAFSLPGDIEVYQAFGSLYKDRFEQQAESTIDSLAAQNYAPLNRSLADAGWDVNVPEDGEANFRMPNWDRLWELGRNPVWTLRTEKGNISIKLNTLSAPATITMIDSLSRAGVYDGIPFHRVVPNFVIQGGDIERRDGFGGPDFVIPTEASEQGFVRGAVGIASAGPDTEGSQYFVMHQWKPHLNGSYTRFGKVVDGMGVVDKITVGDSVISTTWY